MKQTKVKINRIPGDSPIVELNLALRFDKNRLGEARTQEIWTAIGHVLNALLEGDARQDFLDQLAEAQKQKK